MEGDDKAWESVVFYFVWFDPRVLEGLDEEEMESFSELSVQPIIGITRAAREMHTMRGRDSNVAAELCGPWTGNYGDLIPSPHQPMSRLECAKSSLRD